MFRSKPLSQTVGVLVWTLHCVILGMPLHATGLSDSYDFIKLEDREFVCNSGVVALRSEPVSLLSCARACQSEPDCPMFVFGTSGTSTVGSSVGTCSQCPVSNIIGMNFSLEQSMPETWQNVLGYLFNPPTDTFLAIPGALSIAGRFVTVRLRLLDILPDRTYVDIFANDKQDIAARVALRFDFKGFINRIVVSNCVSTNWSTQILPDGVFPFSPGQDVEISIVAINIGFYIYIDGVYMRLIARSAFMMGDIGYIYIHNAETHVVKF